MAKNKTNALGTLTKMLILILGIVTLVLMFINPVVGEMPFSDKAVTLNFATVLFGGTANLGTEVEIVGATIAFPGYLTVFLGSVGVGLTSLLKGKLRLFISIILSFVLLIGASLILHEGIAFESANPVVFATYQFKLVAAPIIAGILGGVASLLTAIVATIEA